MSDQNPTSDSNASRSAAKDRPVLQEAPPARDGHDPVVASDSGRPWILGLVAGLMMVIGLVIGSVVWGSPNMLPFVEPFLLNINEGEYARAYGQIGQEWRAVMPQQKFELLHSELHKRLGDYIAMKQVAMDESTDELLGKIAMVHFNARFEKGEVTLTAVLRKTANGWSLLDVQYVTPLLDGKPTTMPATAPATRPAKAPRTMPAPAPKTAPATIPAH